MDVVSQRDLKILTEIAERQGVTQRSLAQGLGIALGLTNLYLKRLFRKGYIKITTVPPNRLHYFVTPKGFARKARLTAEYMRYSLALYRQTRQTLREAILPLAQQGARRVALYGSGEAAELAYLTLREIGIQPMAVYNGDGGGRFVDLPIRPVADLARDEIDCVIVAAFEAPKQHLSVLTRAGVAPEKIVFVIKGASAPTAG